MNENPELTIRLMTQAALALAALLFYYVAIFQVIR